MGLLKGEVEGGDGDEEEGGGDCVRSSVTPTLADFECVVDVDVGVGDDVDVDVGMEAESWNRRLFSTLALALEAETCELNGKDFLHSPPPDRAKRQ